MLDKRFSTDSKCGARG